MINERQFVNQRPRVGHAPSIKQNMNVEHEEQPITITQSDIAEANRLSLHCPICAGPVEQNTDGLAYRPVICTDCGTLYHEACWSQNGGSCAILGCESKTFRVYGALDLGPTLVINRTDIATTPPVRTVPREANNRTEQLKHNEKRMQREVGRRLFWRGLLESLLRAIRIWPSDLSS